MSEEHYSLGFERDDDGWWGGRCKCGWIGGLYPEAEDACDGLMDHAYVEGVRDAVDAAKRASEEVARPGKETP